MCNRMMLCHNCSMIKDEMNKKCKMCFVRAWMILYWFLIEVTLVREKSVLYCSHCRIYRNVAPLLYNMNVWEWAWLYLCTAESIEWFIEDQNFSPSKDLAPPPPPSKPPPPSLPASCSLFQSSYIRVAGRASWQGGGDQLSGWRRQESLVLYESFNIILLSQFSLMVSMG